MRNRWRIRQKTIRRESHFRFQYMVGFRQIHLTGFLQVLQLGNSSCSEKYEASV